MKTAVICSVIDSFAGDERRRHFQVMYVSFRNRRHGNLESTHWICLISFTFSFQIKNTLEFNFKSNDLRFFSLHWWYGREEEKLRRTKERRWCRAEAFWTGSRAGCVVSFDSEADRVSVIKASIELKWSDEGGRDMIEGEEKRDLFWKWLVFCHRSRPSFFWTNSRQTCKNTLHESEAESEDWKHVVQCHN